MAADGITKLLGPLKQSTFIRQLNIRELDLSRSQTWPWVKKELSKPFKGGYPTQVNIEWRISRKSAGWMDTPLGKSCDAAAWLDRGLDQ